MAGILVVDDDEIMRKVLKNILEKSGFEVTTAASGKDVMELLENNYYDVVVTDLVMPHVNGLQLVKSVRAGCQPHTGIIVISTLGNEETITEAFRLGADDYITKPVAADNLLARIRKLIADKNSNTRFVTKKK